MARNAEDNGMPQRNLFTAARIHSGPQQPTGIKEADTRQHQPTPNVCQVECTYTSDTTRVPHLYVGCLAGAATCIIAAEAVGGCTSRQVVDEEADVHTLCPHSTAQHSTAQHSTAQHSTAQHSTAQHSTAQHSTAQHSTPESEWLAAAADTWYVGLPHLNQVGPIRK
jgi:hypothetical protein